MKVHYEVKVTTEQPCWEPRLSVQKTETVALYEGSGDGPASTIAGVLRALADELSPPVRSYGTANDESRMSA